MMGRMQRLIESNLAFLGEHNYVQAVVIIAVSFVVTWISVVGVPDGVSFYSFH